MGYEYDPNAPLPQVIFTTEYPITPAHLQKGVTFPNMDHLGNLKHDGDRELLHTLCGHLGLLPSTSKSLHGICEVERLLKEWHESTLTAKESTHD